MHGAIMNVYMQVMQTVTSQAALRRFFNCLGLSKTDRRHQTVHQREGSLETWEINILCNMCWNPTSRLWHISHNIFHLMPMAVESFSGIWPTPKCLYIYIYIYMSCRMQFQINFYIIVCLQSVFVIHCIGSRNIQYIKYTGNTQAIEFVLYTVFFCLFFFGDWLGNSAKSVPQNRGNGNISFHLIKSNVYNWKLFFAWEGPTATPGWSDSDPRMVLGFPLSLPAYIPP